MRLPEVFKLLRRFDGKIIPFLKTKSCRLRIYTALGHAG